MKSSIAPGQRAAVLVSEHSRLSCEVLSLALTRSPYRYHVAACVCSSGEFTNALRNSGPVQVALVSARLDDGELAGFRVLREIRRNYPAVPVVLLVDTPDRELVVNAFRAGVKGTFPRTGTFEDLCKCIYQVSNGQIWATTEELQMVLETLASAPPLRVVDARGLELLTKRQQQILMLVADGLTNKEVATRLSLSEHTVRNYLFRIFDKLGVSSRMELILYATNSERYKSGDEKPAA